MGFLLLERLVACEPEASLPVQPWMAAALALALRAPLLVRHPQAQHRDPAPLPSSTLCSARRFARCFALAAVMVAVLGAAPATIVQPAAVGEPWSGDAVARLDGDLNAMLADSPAIRGAHVGVYAIDTATGDVLYARDADDEFQPASTLKLLVGSAALEKLGAEFRFRTSVLRYGYESFALIGGGDPTLTSADIVEAAKHVASTFPAHTVVNVAVDATHFDRESYQPGWTWDDFGQDYAPPISALTVDEDVVRLRVTPNPPLATISATADVAIVPYDRVCDQRTMPRVGIGSVAALGARGSDDTIDVRIGRGGCIEVFGKLPLDARPEDVDASVPSPEFFARSTFRDALSAAGVTVPDIVPDLTLPDDAPMPVVRVTTRTGTQLPDPVVAWHHDSDPLSALLGPRFWIPSDNLFGELLLKELGFASAGRPGTTDKGTTYEKQWLQSIGVDPGTTTLADGCGMSQYDRITPHDLVTILQHDWNGPNRQLVLDSLPVGGARGTIEGIAGTPVAGRVFAKTGSMMHVRGLAGYLATLHHGAVTFAFNVDDWNGDYPALAALRAQVLARIATDGS